MINAALKPSQQLGMLGGFDDKLEALFHPPSFVMQKFKGIAMSLDLKAIQRLIHTVNQNNKAIETENSWCEALGHSVDNDCSKILDGVNPTDVIEAVKCLDMLINTNDNVRKAMGVKGKPGRKNGDKLNEEKTPDAFLIVAALDAGAMTYCEARDAITETFDVDESTAKNFIKKFRQSIDQ